MGCWILALTAISGEIPTNLLPKLPSGERVQRTHGFLSQGKGLLRTCCRGHPHGYWLGRRAKTLLLAQESERSSFFCTDDNGLLYGRYTTADRDMLTPYLRLRYDERRVLGAASEA